MPQNMSSNLFQLIPGIAKCKFLDGSAHLQKGLTDICNQQFHIGMNVTKVGESTLLKIFGKLLRD